jgi:hypothetical protein
VQGNRLQVQSSAEVHRSDDVLKRWDDATS